MGLDILSDESGFAYTLRSHYGNKPRTPIYYVHLISNDGCRGLCDIPVVFDE